MQVAFISCLFSHFLLENCFLVSLLAVRRCNWVVWKDFTAESMKIYCRLIEIVDVSYGDCVKRFQLLGFGGEFELFERLSSPNNVQRSSESFQKLPKCPEIPWERFKSKKRRKIPKIGVQFRGKTLVRPRFRSKIAKSVHNEEEASYWTPLKHEYPWNSFADFSSPTIPLSNQPYNNQTSLKMPPNCLKNTAIQTFLNSIQFKSDAIRTLMQIFK